jgi:ATP-dependent Clp protease adaptor protein ClpS
VWPRQYQLFIPRLPEFDADTDTGTTTDVDIEFVVMDEEELERPYRVIIHNDHVTPFDFVIAVLVTIFELPANRAIEVTYEAHTKGNAYVGTFPLEQAKSRVYKAQYVARENGFPLTFTVEPE